MSVCGFFLLFIFFLQEMSESVDYRDVCCRSLYCNTVYISYADGNNFKMTPNLHLHIFTERKMCCNDIIQEQDKDCSKKKDFFAPP